MLAKAWGRTWSTLAATTESFSERVGALSGFWMSVTDFLAWPRATATLAALSAASALAAALFGLLLPVLPVVLDGRKLAIGSRASW